MDEPNRERPVDGPPAPIDLNDPELHERIIAEAAALSADTYRRRAAQDRRVTAWAVPRPRRGRVRP